MKDAMKRYLPVLALAAFGMVMMGCDKSPFQTRTPEAKPTAPKAAAPAAINQEAFVSEKGGFTVALPPGFPPFQISGEDGTDPDKIAFKYTSEKSDQAACLIMVNSNANWDLSDPKIVLDSARDGGVNSNPGNILEREVDFKLSGYPGRRIFIQQKNGSDTFFMRDDVVLVQTRLYQIMYVSAKKADLNTPKVLAYFNSFKLTYVPESEPVRESPSSVTKRRLEFTLPADWIAQGGGPKKDGSTITLMDFSKGDDIRGLYMMEEGVGNATLETLVSNFMEGVQGSSWADFEVLDAAKTGWGGMRRDCRARRLDDDALVHWANVFIVMDGNFYVVSVITLDENTDRYQSEIDSFFDSIVVR